MNWITYIFIIAQCVGPSVQFEICNQVEDFRTPNYGYQITQEGDFYARGFTPRLETGECYTWPLVNAPGEITLTIPRLDVSVSKTCTILGDPPEYMINTYLPSIHNSP